MISNDQNYTTALASWSRLAAAAAAVGLTSVAMWAVIG